MQALPVPDGLFRSPTDIDAAFAVLPCVTPSPQHMSVLMLKTQLLQNAPSGLLLQKIQCSLALHRRHAVSVVRHRVRQAWDSRLERVAPCPAPHLVLLLLGAVARQVGQAQHDERAARAAQHQAPRVARIHTDRGQLRLCAELALPQRLIACGRDPPPLAASVLSSFAKSQQDVLPLPGFP